MNVLTVLMLPYGYRQKEMCMFNIPNYSEYSFLICGPRMNVWVPWNLWNCLTVCGTISLWKLKLSNVQISQFSCCNMLWDRRHHHQFPHFLSCSIIQICFFFMSILAWAVQHIHLEFLLSLQTVSVKVLIHSYASFCWMFYQHTASWFSTTLFSSDYMWQI